MDIPKVLIVNTDINQLNYKHAKQYEYKEYGNKVW